VSAERQQEQARAVYLCPECSQQAAWLSGGSVSLGTVFVERAPFEERVRREERDRIVAYLRSLHAAYFAGNLAVAADFIESLPVSPGPEEGEQ
jgi:hypothetical protein